MRRSPLPCIVLAACSSFARIPAQDESLIETTTDVRVGDINGDGKMDVLCGNRGGPTRVYVQGEKRKFLELECPALRAAARDTRSIALFDIDGDKDLDLVEGNADGRSQAFLNDGKGGFTPIAADMLTIPGAVRDLAEADFDGDGDLDLVVVVASGKGYLLRNAGTGRFTRVMAAVPNTTTGGQTLAVGDLDGDGDIDLVVGLEKRGPSLRVMINQGNGQFTDQSESWVPEQKESSVSCLLLTDTDDDGRLDLMVGDSKSPGSKSGDRERHYRNSGRSFQRIQVARMPRYRTTTTLLATIDLDGDGERDLIHSADAEHRSLAVVRKAKKRFIAKTPTEVYYELRPLTALLIVDVDGNGRDDIVVGTDGGSGWVLMNPSLEEKDGVTKLNFWRSSLRPRHQSFAKSKVRWLNDTWGTPSIDLRVAAGGRYSRRLEYRVAYQKKRNIRRVIGDGLKWLARNQSEDGRWDADDFSKGRDRGYQGEIGRGRPTVDIGVTGLALLAFLAENPSTDRGPHKETVKKAIAWLVGQQNAKTGLIGTNASMNFIYSHAIATLALCEAYMITGSLAAYSCAVRAIRYLESHRNPYAVWRYQPRDSDNDSSVTGWCVMAYVAAKSAKIEVNAQALRTAVNFMDELTDPRTGAVGYKKRGEGSYRYGGTQPKAFPFSYDRSAPQSLTASGLYQRALLGQSAAKVEVIQLGLARIRASRSRDGVYDLYYWMHASHAISALANAEESGWTKELIAVLRLKQATLEDAKGSFPADCVWGEFGGRVYSTAMALLSLQAPYRVYIKPKGVISKGSRR